MTQIQPINGSKKPSGLLSKVVKGKLSDRPIRVILYGAEGVGKSTFAADAPNPIFLCGEDGTAQLDIARLPEPTTWADVQDSVRALATEDHDYKTLVLDTLDWLEPLCHKHTASRANKPDLESFGFGKGYIAAVETWRALILDIQAMCLKRRMNLIALAHSHVKRIDDPLSGSYDRHALKIHEKSAALWKESVDAVLFARVETFTVTDERTKKARQVGTGSRIVHTTPTAGYDAKNRFALPDQIELDWSIVEQAARGTAQQNPEQVRAEIVALLPKLKKVDQRKAELTETWLSKPQSIENLLTTLDKTRTTISGHEDEKETE